jgi:hypothetical protein
MWAAGLAHGAVLGKSLQSFFRVGKLTRWSRGRCPRGIHPGKIGQCFIPTHDGARRCPCVTAALQDDDSSVQCLVTREPAAEPCRAGKGVAMHKLPARYRTVGGLSIAYATLMAVFLVFSVSNMPLTGAPKLQHAVDWLVVGAFVLTPLPLLLGGFRLCSKKAATRETTWLLFIAGLLLLLKAFALTLALYQELAHTHSGTAGLGAFVALTFIIMPASIWGVVVLFTAALLDLRLRPLSKTAPDRAGFPAESEEQR